LGFDHKAITKGGQWRFSDIGSNIVAAKIFWEYNVTDRVLCLLESFASNYSESIDGG
jgi:hypothetical protein